MARRPRVRPARHRDLHPEDFFLPWMVVFLTVTGRTTFEPCTAGHAKAYRDRRRSVGRGPEPRARRGPYLVVMRAFAGPAGSKVTVTLAGLPLVRLAVTVATVDSLIVLVSS